MPVRETIVISPSVQSYENIQETFEKYRIMSNMRDINYKWVLKIYCQWLRVLNRANIPRVVFDKMCLVFTLIIVISYS